jgi:hypothetical protein
LIEQWTGVKDLVTAVRDPDIRATRTHIDFVSRELNVLIQSWKIFDPEFGQRCTMQKGVLRARTLVDRMEMNLACEAKAFCDDVGTHQRLVSKAHS